MLPCMFYANCFVQKSCLFKEDIYIRKFFFLNNKNNNKIKKITPMSVSCLVFIFRRELSCVTIRSQLIMVIGLRVIVFSFYWVGESLSLLGIIDYAIWSFLVLKLPNTICNLFCQTGYRKNISGHGGVYWSMIRFKFQNIGESIKKNIEFLSNYELWIGIQCDTSKK